MTAKKKSSWEEQMPDVFNQLGALRYLDERGTQIKGHGKRIPLQEAIALVRRIMFDRQDLPITGGVPTPSSCPKFMRVKGGLGKQTPPRVGQAISRAADNLHDLERQNNPELDNGKVEGDKNTSEKGLVDKVRRLSIRLNSINCDLDAIYHKHDKQIDTIEDQLKELKSGQFANDRELDKHDVEIGQLQNTTEGDSSNIARLAHSLAKLKQKLGIPLVDEKGGGLDPPKEETLGEYAQRSQRWGRVWKFQIVGSFGETYGPYDSIDHLKRALYELTRS